MLTKTEIRFHTNPGLSKPSFEQPSPGRHYAKVHGVIFEYNFLLKPLAPCVLPVFHLKQHEHFYRW